VSDPIPIDLEPMLAAPKADLPIGEDWVYEPKWDGFRSLVHRNGDRIDLASRGRRPLTRYFPELLDPFGRLPSDQAVLDGEIILVARDGLDFDGLGQRIHPAESRIRMLSETTPAEFVAFDLLALEGEDLRSRPWRERRKLLDDLLASAPRSIRLTPTTTDPATALRWFVDLEGSGLDGVIAKRGDERYLPGKRQWVKRKHERTADCVVIGYRTSDDGKTLGSLLMGAYGDDGTLHYVGHISGFETAARRALLQQVSQMRLEEAPDADQISAELGRRPGALNRWSSGKDQAWNAIRPEIVVEVRYDKLQSGERFRHAAGFLRWRPDKAPEQCLFRDIVAQEPENLGSPWNVLDRGATA
jgi:ATP-dependent DNA ligase